MPSGFSPGQKRWAKRSLTITTPCLIGIVIGERTAAPNRDTQGAKIIRADHPEVRIGPFSRRAWEPPLDAEVNGSGQHAGRALIDRAGRFDSRQRLDTPQHVIEETTHLLAAGVAGLSSHACMVSTPSGLNPRSMPMRFNELRSMRPAPAPHLDHHQRVGEPAARAAACARPAAFEFVRFRLKDSRPGAKPNSTPVARVTASVKA